MKTSTAVNSSRIKLKRQDERACWMLLIIPLTGFILFTLYPMLWAIIKSFYSYDGIASHTAFVGLENWKNILTDGEYWKTWTMNLKLFIFKMPVEALLAFLIANLLMAKTKLSDMYRSIYFLPAIISGAITGLIFSNMFDYFGVFNAYLVKWGIIDSNINWFANKWTAFAVVYLGTLWHSLGTNILYFLAALSTVPKEVMESADVDGANAFVKLFKIKLPMILPTMQVLMLLSLNGILHLGEPVLLLTNGAPGGETYTVAAYQFSKIVPGFGTVSDIGYAAAMSIVTSVIYCICAVVFNKLTKKMQSIY